MTNDKSLTILRQEKSGETVLRGAIRARVWKGIKTEWKELDLRVREGKGSTEKYCNPLRKMSVIWRVCRSKQMSVSVSSLKFHPICCSENQIPSGQAMLLSS